MPTLVRENPPGTVCQYSSADTQALSMLLRAVTGVSVAEYMSQNLCEPLGLESPSYWLHDSEGTEVAFAGILMTARDFAKIGELYRKGGAWDGRQIIPADYVASSIRISAPHLQAGRTFVGGHPFPLGYGYQWWIPAGDHGEFSAIGVYNQYVYVDPSRNVVIVKLSANPAYGTSHLDEDNKDEENIFGLRAISRVFD
jgi:CubicO group peptidase (beta-lactamase class C family)